MTDIRLPNISASADASTQMAQMRSYLYQMVEQLNWALSALDSGGTASLPVQTASRSVQTVGKAEPATSDETDQRMANLRDLIIKSAESVQMELDAIKKDYKSIASVTESYYKSNSPTELTGGTWTDTYPGWEPGTYIWTRSTVTYSDGSEPTTTTPVCVTGAKGDSGVDGVSPTVSITKSGDTTTITIVDKNGTHTQTVKDGTDGTPGAPGADGKTPYFHVKYSDDGGETFTSNGGETPGQYIGTYTDYTVSDSTSVSDYTWAKIKGNKGDPGKDGVNGKDGADGKDGVSPTVSITKSGDTTTITITDKDGTHTQTVKDGTNGTPGTPGADGKTPYLHLKYSDDGGTTFTADSGETPGAYIGTYTDFTEADSTSVSDYTWAKIKGEQGVQGNPGKDGRPGEKGNKGDTGIGIQAVDVLYRTASSDTELSDSEMPPNGWYTEAPTTTEGTYLWSCSKITYTDGTTSYTAPYCISVEVGNILNRGLEGVYSYMDERVESLSSTYVARSDFGTYREDINQRITTNSTKIEQQFAFAAEIQANTNRVEVDFAAYKTDVQGYIRQGIVGYDGTIPIIGIAIGQDIRTTGTSVETDRGVFDEIDKRSNMSVWTTEKLSFYIGGQEAAYFSNGKLTVSQIATDRITGSGKWDVSFTNGVKFKWMGG